MSKDIPIQEIVQPCVQTIQGIHAEGSMVVLTVPDWLWVVLFTVNAVVGIFMVFSIIRNRGQS